MAIEEPAFTIVETDHEIEIRHYAPMIVAEATLEGDLQTASNAGFRVIADYIFGNNHAAHDADRAMSQKIAMTAPVTVMPTDDSMHREMTAPVTLAAQGGPAQGGPAQGDPGWSMTAAKRWRVHFVLPQRYAMSVLPRPNNEAVTVREVPATRYAVVKFSGLAGAAKLQKHTARLFGWLKEKNYLAIGSPQLARYDPPWTLPFFRRNEVMIEIDSALKGRRTEPLQFSLRT